MADWIDQMAGSGDWIDTLAASTKPAKRYERFPHEWDDADLRKSQAAQDAARAASENQDEENTPILDRAAHVLMGATESVPGESLADEAAGALATVPSALKPLLTSPLGPEILAASVGVDRLRGLPRFSAGRDQQREAKAISDADPLVHLGRIGGAVAQLPIGGAGVAGKGLVGAALEGAGAGGLGGLLEGAGEGDSMKERALNALEQGGQGAVAGGVLGGALGGLGGLRGTGVDVDLSTPVRNATASALSAASKIAPTAGQVIGAVKGGAAAGPFGIAGGAMVGKRAGQVTAQGLSKIASVVRPLVDITPDMVVDTKPGPIPYDILEDLGVKVKPEPSPTVAQPASPSSTAPDVVDAEYEVTHQQPPSSRPSLKMLPEGQRVDYTGQAEAFDPGGEAWHTWLTDKAPEPTARPELDEAAKILAQKTGAAGAPVYNPEGIGTPKTPIDLRDAALSELEGVGSPGDSKPSGPPNLSPLTEWLGPSFDSLPLAGRGAAMTEPQLKAAVQMGVDQGVPLKALAKTLGVNQSDIAAYFKGAQLGNLFPKPGPRNIARFTSDGLPVDEDLEFARARRPEATESLVPELEPVVINLGGEGEARGAVDTNLGFQDRNMLLRPLDDIKAENPGRQVGGDMRALPYRDDSADQVVGKRVPPMLLARHGDEIAAEIVRVLKPGGTARLSTRGPVFGPGGGARAWFEAHGFTFPSDYAAVLQKPPR